MSQEKVNRYKEEKKNRAKLLKKEKRHERMVKGAVILVALLLVGWVGYSGYVQISGNVTREGKTYSVDTASLDEYMSSVSTEGETEAAE